MPAWKARLVAQRTKALCPDAAAFVDVAVAPRAERFGYARLDRLVAEAGARFAPDLSALADAEAAQGHHVTLTTRPDPGIGVDTMAGHAYLEATLDPADALDLESAVAAIAHGLLEDQQASNLTLDQRRAQALGVLARHYTAGQAGGVARVVHLYCHLSPGEGTGLVAVDNLQTVVPLERVEAWATTPGTVVKPVTVIDLNQSLTHDGYAPSARQREQAYLIAGVCAFPGCEKPAIPTGRLDLDHITAFDAGGQTSTENLAPLCRGHHRAKTHDAWSYTQIHPGEYLWRSPHGAHYLRHHGGGTTTITTADTG
ncbi:HNH endonuclease [Nocardioides sp. DS6]|uniref:HNH endonuclease n=1 Tax=Nocardioides eburneus TaxID=3231482 RepID=A0ABV3SZW8_9ACTN